MPRSKCRGESVPSTSFRAPLRTPSPFEFFPSKLVFAQGYSTHARLVRGTGEDPVSLKQLGWNSYFDALWQEREQLEWLPARVISQQRGLWRVAGDFAETWAEASGTLRAGAEAGGGLPGVGGWVAAGILRCGRPLIHKVLPRRSKVLRKVALRRVQKQVISPHLCTAF